jgi:hypothetical protein
MFSRLIIVWTVIAPVMRTASAEIKFGTLHRLEAAGLYTLFKPQDSCVYFLKNLRITLALYVGNRGKMVRFFPIKSSLFLCMPGRCHDA